MHTFRVEWFWQPVGVGRHAFRKAARRAEPDAIVLSYCGVEVSASKVQRQAGELAWIEERTCMDCWRSISDRAG